MIAKEYLAVVNTFWQQTFIMCMHCYCAWLHVFNPKHIYAVLAFEANLQVGVQAE